jgi:hypothetical protein
MVGVGAAVLIKKVWPLSCHSRCYVFEPRLSGRGEDLPIRVIRVNPDDEVIARANNLIVGSAARRTAVRLYPRGTIQYRDRARIIARSEPKRS